MIVLLEFGILLRLMNRNDPLHGTIRAAVRALKGRGDLLAMSAQNIAEFWNVCTRPATARGGLGLSIAEADKRFRLLERIIQILPDTSAAYPIWRNHVAHLSISGVQVHDARLAALMQASGVTHILTLNTATSRGIAQSPPSIRPRSFRRHREKTASPHFAAAENRP
jgi:predicted nucleic acid-binding protein